MTPGLDYAWHDLLGNAGVVLIVLCYLLLQIGKVQSNDKRYLAGNALGALLVLVSLIEAFNLSAFLIEAFWLAISIYGLAFNARWVRARSE